MISPRKLQQNWRAASQVWTAKVGKYFHFYRVLFWLNLMASASENLIKYWEREPFPIFTRILILSVGDERRRGGAGCPGQPLGQLPHPHRVLEQPTQLPRPESRNNEEVGYSSDILIKLHMFVKIIIWQNVHLNVSLWCCETADTKWNWC